MSESEAEEKPVASKKEKDHPVASSSKSIREKVDTHQKVGVFLALKTVFSYTN